MPYNLSIASLKIKLHLKTSPFCCCPQCSSSLKSIWVPCVLPLCVQHRGLDRTLVSWAVSHTRVPSMGCDQSIRINVIWSFTAKRPPRALCFALCAKHQLQNQSHPPDMNFLKDLNAVNNSKPSLTRFTPGALCNLSGLPCASSNACIMLKCKSVSCQRGGRESLKKESLKGLANILIGA